MVLSGTLKEFILADVFNLLTQQRITGKLILVCDKREGSIVFKDGLIVGAECGEENLPNKLFNYLVDIKKRTPESLTQLFSSNAGNLGALCSVAMERGILTHKELKSFAESCVEDICCSLLTWDRGTYRFSSLRSINNLVCGAVVMSHENVIMEGMRRVDEWARMQDYIKDDMIFVPTAKKGSGMDTPDELNPVTAPEEYVLSMLNGSSTIKAIIKSGCLCEYRVFEAINMLLQAQRISALHQKYTQSIQAALKRKDAEEASVLGKTLFGSLLSVGVAASVAAIFLFVRVIALPEFGVGAKEKEAAYIPDAVESALLLHHAISGEIAEDLTVLENAGLLTRKDYTR